MGVVFIPEITERGEHRVGRGLPQTAEGTVFNGFPQFFQTFRITGAGVFICPSPLGADRLAQDKVRQNGNLARLQKEFLTRPKDCPCPRV